jgi:hypothetical protein
MHLLLYETFAGFSVSIACGRVMVGWCLGSGGLFVVRFEISAKRSSHAGSLIPSCIELHSPEWRGVAQMGGGG